MTASGAPACWTRRPTTPAKPAAAPLSGSPAGINQGLIDRDTYLPRVQKAWNALTASVADDGKLRNVQPVGAGPHGFDPDNAEPFAAGAFLLLAKELYQMTTARH